MSDYGRTYCGWSQLRRRGHRKTGPKSGAPLGLPGGSEVLFRAVEPEDARALRRFLGRCSERTIYLRFFGSLGEVSEEKAKYLASVDGTDHFGLVALHPEDHDEIIAMVRYDREPREERAEYAAIVEDGWQDHVIGIDLTRRLISAARENGVRYFYAMVMGKNTRMLELLRHLDLPEEERKEGGVKHVDVELSY